MGAECWNEQRSELEEQDAAPWIIEPLFGAASPGNCQIRGLTFAGWWFGDWRRINGWTVATLHTIAIDDAGRVRYRRCMLQQPTDISEARLWQILDSEIDPVLSGQDDPTRWMPFRPPVSLRVAASHLLHMPTCVHRSINTDRVRSQCAIPAGTVASRYFHAALLAAMDMEVLPHAHSLTIYHHVLGTREASGIVRRNRRQALASMPLIIGDVAEGRAQETARAIDLGLPLFPAIQKDYAVPAWVARRLPRISLQQWRFHGFDSATAPKQALQLIQWCGENAPHLRPEEFLQLLRRLHRPSAHEDECLDKPEGAGKTLRTSFLFGMLGREAARCGWARTLALVSASVAKEPLVAELSVEEGWMDSLGDYLRFLMKAIFAANEERLTYCAHDQRLLIERLGIVLKRLLHSQSLPQCLRLMTAWHLALGHTQLTSSSPRMLTSGAANILRIMGPCSLIGSRYRVEQLLTPIELQQEGLAMQHCVASYADDALHARCLILSIHHPDTRCRATLRFHLDNQRGQSWTWVLDEAKSERNRPPGPATVVAIDECVALLNLHLVGDVSIAEQRYRNASVCAGSGFDDDAVVTALVHSPHECRWLPGARACGPIPRLRRAYDDVLLASTPNDSTSPRWWIESIQGRLRDP